MGSVVVDVGSLMCKSVRIIDVCLLVVLLPTTAYLAAATRRLGVLIAAKEVTPWRHNDKKKPADDNSTANIENEDLVGAFILFVCTLVKSREALRTDGE
jgi:hypothetical protein